MSSKIISKNIAIITMGQVWSIAVEFYSFLDPVHSKFYENHKLKDKIEEERNKACLKPTTEFWILTTCGPKPTLAMKNIIRWWEIIGKPAELYIFQCEGTDDLSTPDECLQMREMIYRCVLRASEECAPSGQLVICLAGGRKTMSADIQQAGNIFGCQNFIHIIETSDDIPLEFKNPAPELLCNPPPATVCSKYMPVVMKGSTKRFEIEIDKNKLGPITSTKYPLNKFKIGEFNYISVTPNLIFEIETRIEESSRLHYNFIKSITEIDQMRNFWSLYRLEPQKIEKLRKTILKGNKNCEEFVHWFRKIPKADLHCHIGGVLDVKKQVLVGCAVVEEIPAKWKSKIFKSVEPFVKQVEKNIKQKDFISHLINYNSSYPVHFRIAAFLSYFKNREEVIENFLYEKFLQGNCFAGVWRDESISKENWFKAYESLGDLSGSKILQTESALRKTAQLISDYAKEIGLRYLELRGSPNKYTRGGLDEMKVIEILADEFKKNSLRNIQNGAMPLDVRFIFIVSRRAPIGEAVQKAIKAKEKFPDFVAGIDLAGDEAEGNIEKIINIFELAMKECLPITIHAGEKGEVGNVWDAVYRLHAERIGHGLNIFENEKLLERLRDMKVCIEMCPSSNLQIAGFRCSGIEGSEKFNEYPLEYYLKRKLRITLNTDNPGISKTDLIKEYIMAAKMTSNGLSLWDILILVKAGFKSAFLPLIEKEKLLNDIDFAVYDLISKSPNKYPFSL